MVATGYAGGRTGADLCADLDARGIAHRFVDGGDARRTVTVVSAAHGDATVFNEPGPVVPADAWTSLVRLVGDLVREHGAGVVVLSGSLPRGLPADACSQLVGVAHAHGARAVVDVDGAALRDAVTAAPEVVKPNRHELLVGHGLHRHRHRRGGAAVQRRPRRRRVGRSRGPPGVPLRGRPLRAWLPDPLSGNPTGAGDALVAALAAGLEAGERVAGGGRAGGGLVRRRGAPAGGRRGGPRRRERTWRARSGGGDR